MKHMNKTMICHASNGNGKWYAFGFSYDKRQWSSKEVEEEKHCRSSSSGFDLFFFSSTRHSRSCSAKTKSSTRGGSNELLRNVISSKGSKPYKDLVGMYLFVRETDEGLQWTDPGSKLLWFLLDLVVQIVLHKITI